MFKKQYQTFLILFCAATIGLAAAYITAKNQSAKEAIIKERAERGVRLRSTDHRRGAKNAAITMIEYGEVECPYCKALHPVLKKIVSDYPNDVAWVYRQFPLASHPKSFNEAVALECVYEQGGDEMFWHYLDSLYEITPSNNKIDLAVLPEIAVKLGVNRESFDVCTATERYREKIEDDIKVGLVQGVVKVPLTIIVSHSGGESSFVGSRSYQFLKIIIDALLKEELDAKNDVTSGN